MDAFSPFAAFEPFRTGGVGVTVPAGWEVFLVRTEDGLSWERFQVRTADDSGFEDFHVRTANG
jgi:hypothetical protein